MLEASFDASRNRGASISGAYQYDTGQRIKLLGLPSPAELAQMDDFLSGDVVTVQAQYAYVGERQSEPRIALYDERENCYVAEVPDKFLTASDTVNMYVYVSYGESETSTRSKTQYVGSFRPISRPAPNGAVTPDQKNAWDALVGEVNLALSNIGTAVSDANGAAQKAREAGDAANEAADSIKNATAKVTTLAAGSDATVGLSENQDGTKCFEFGIPRGAKGAKGDRGEKGDTGPAGVTFRLDGATLYITTAK